MPRPSFSEAEIADHADFEAIGLQAQAASDNLWLDAIGYPAHWAAFTVARKSAQEITVSAGRFVAGKIVYAQDAPKDCLLYTSPSPRD